jgi:hypothetical protein
MFVTAVMIHSTLELAHGQLTELPLDFWISAPYNTRPTTGLGGALDEQFQMSPAMTI